MKFVQSIKIVALLLALLSPQLGQTSGGAALPKQEWNYQGIFATFDNAAIKRGAQVAVQSCMSCHSIKYIKFDSLRQFGLTEAEVKTLAESQGKTKKDKLISAMDAESAKAAFGTAPPDLSLIVKARKGFEDYVYGILTGYASDEDKALVERALLDGSLGDGEVLELASHLHLDAHNPKRVLEVAERIKNGDNFNKYFPGNFFAMPQPLSDGQIDYTDGTKNSKEQLARDVVTFLAWASEPTAMERKALGVNVMIYLVILTVLLYAVKRRVWAKLH